MARTSDTPSDATRPTDGARAGIARPETTRTRSPNTVRPDPAVPEATVPETELPEAADPPATDAAPMTARRATNGPRPKGAAPRSGTARARSPRLADSLPERFRTVVIQDVTPELDAGRYPIKREEGDVLIIPVLEEVVVVEKRLMLKEELRIRRSRGERPVRETVTLRTEEVSIEQTPRPDLSLRASNIER